MAYSHEKEKAAQGQKYPEPLSAPPGTRTPNLLIKSHSVTRLQAAVGSRESHDSPVVRYRFRYPAAETQVLAGNPGSVVSRQALFEAVASSVPPPRKGWIDWVVADLPTDLLSLTAHKFYGPKGIGALYVKTGTPLLAQMFGGGQQRRLRPGTLAVDLIAGLGEAALVAATSHEDDFRRLAAQKKQLLEGIKDIDGLHVNGALLGAYPGILNVGVEDIEGESLLLALEPLCVATGSACNSQSQEPSYVLRALGLSDQQAQSAIRFSLGRTTSSDDVERAVVIYRNAVEKLRNLAPERVA